MVLADLIEPFIFVCVTGTYIDKKCPFTGTVSIRGRILAGTCHSAKMIRTIIVRRNYLHFVKKYQRHVCLYFFSFFCTMSFLLLLGELFYFIKLIFLFFLLIYLLTIDMRRGIQTFLHTCPHASE